MESWTDNNFHNGNLQLVKSGRARSLHGESTQFSKLRLNDDCNSSPDVDQTLNLLYGL